VGGRERGNRRGNKGKGNESETKGTNREEEARWEEGGKGEEDKMMKGKKSTKRKGEWKGAYHQKEKVANSSDPPRKNSRNRALGGGTSQRARGKWKGPNFFSARKGGSKKNQKPLRGLGKL